MTLTALEKNIGYTFNNKTVLQQALTHKSFSNENTGAAHNERLEFLGDAVLQYVSTDFLYHAYPEEPEGILTAYRSLLVSTDALIKVAQDIALQEHIRVSVGQQKEMHKRPNAILANTIEALIAALYIDGGFTTAKTFITTHILQNAESILKESHHQDSKTRFQEAAQRETALTPTYQLIKEEGPDHAKQFEVAVYLGDTQIAKGNGLSKQEAERDAAKNALAIKEW